MEYADGGDLLHGVSEHKKCATEFKEKEIWDALIHMTKGLKCLHDRHIFHRDLKAANIFR